MRYLALVISLFISVTAYADTCGTSLMPTFTANQATQLCKVFGSAVNHSLIPSADNTYDLGSSSLGWRTAYVDTSVITPLVNHASSLALGIAGTAEVTLTDDTLTYSGTTGVLQSAGTMRIRASSDANRLFNFASGSDTDLQFTFGDSGVTASQALTIRSTTSDAADNSEITVASGGLSGSDRGADVRLSANESGNAGQYRVRTGNVAGADLVQSVTDDFIVQDQSAASSLSIDVATKAAVFGGAVTSSGTSALGWTPVAAANQACNTTCTSACVFGIDSAAPQTWLLCTDATADMCLCAGAS